MSILNNDQTNWALTGIRDERLQLEKRLEYLKQAEASLNSPRPAKTAKPTEGLGKRKKVISQESRDRMSQAHKDRWARKRAAAQAAPIQQALPASETQPAQ